MSQIQENGTYFVKSYGCQMNVYDGDRMSEMLETIGYKRSDTFENAGIVILNTCHIREKASEKVYSELGRIRQEKERLKNDNKNMIIVVAGCVAQAEGIEVIKRAPFVDAVVGPESYHKLLDIIYRSKRHEKNVVSLDFNPIEKFDSIMHHRSSKNVSEFLTIQEGCDKFCTFCVVPYTRGAEFSRPVQQIIDEAKKLIDNGTKEIVLLGQNVNAYHGIQGDTETTLAQLIYELDKIPALKRIRYTTSHPLNMTEDLIQAHGSIAKLMPYLHLPVQSGSNRILQLMNRKHDRDFYFKIIEDLRKKRPDIAFSSDFIVGFPTETDQDFIDTIDLVKQIKYTQCYSFKYSPRPGTPAALQDQVSEEIKDRRLQELQHLLQQQFDSFNQSALNTTQEVLVEKQGTRPEYKQITGKTPHFQAVAIDIDQNDSIDNYVGKIIKTKVIEVKTNSLRGKII